MRAWYKYSAPCYANRMDTYAWYQLLEKPFWAPPAWVFGPVWTILYILITISFCAVFYKVWKGSVPLAVTLPFVLNLAANFAFSPIQFGLQNNVIAAVDILLILGTLVWGMVAIYPYARWITYAQIPYLLWVSFATVLQLTITYLNW